MIQLFMLQFAIGYTGPGQKMESLCLFIDKGLAL